MDGDGAHPQGQRVLVRHTGHTQDPAVPARVPRVGGTYRAPVRGVLKVVGREEAMAMGVKSPGFLVFCPWVVGFYQTTRFFTQKTGFLPKKTGFLTKNSFFFFYQKPTPRVFAGFLGFCSISGTAGAQRAVIHIIDQHSYKGSETTFRHHKTKR